MPEPSRFAIDFQMNAGLGPPVMTIRDGIGKSSMRTGGVSSDDVAGFLDRNRSSPSVEVRINSNGGDAVQGMEIYNALLDFPGTVVTVNEGMALSAACLIFTAGKRRVMTAGSQLMIHEASLQGLSGNADRIREALVYLESLNQTAAEMMANRIGQTTLRVRDLMKRETWFDPDKAVSERFATEKSGASAKMSASLDLSPYRNVPPAFSRFKSAVSAIAEDRFSVVL